MPSLIDIGRRHGSDKFLRHGFGPTYQHWFRPRRKSVLSILEIGVGDEDFALGGRSLKTWIDYFPRANVLGIDLFDKSVLDCGRLHTRICDQNDPVGLAAVAAEFGPFDIIIDDGSHKAGDVNRALFALFRHLVPGGLYFIEDVQTSYWATYGGSSLIPDAYDTALRWLKFSIDIVNRGECLESTYYPLQSDLPIGEVHVYHNLAVLTRTAEPTGSRVLTEEMRRANLTLDQSLNAAAYTVQQRLLAEPHLQRRLCELIAGRGGLQAVLTALEGDGNGAPPAGLSQE